MLFHFLICFDMSEGDYVGVYEAKVYKYKCVGVSVSVCLSVRTRTCVWTYRKGCAQVIRVGRG